VSEGVWDHGVGIGVYCGEKGKQMIQFTVDKHYVQMPLEDGITLIENALLMIHGRLLGFIKSP